MTGAWTIAPLEVDLVARLATELEIGEVTASVLARRGYGDPDAARSVASPPDGNGSAASRVRRIDRLFHFALGRDPTIDELTDALEFVDDGPAVDDKAKLSGSPLSRWEQLAQVLLMSNEFIFVD